MRLSLLGLFAGITSWSCAGPGTPTPVGGAEDVATAIGDLSEEVDTETWHGVYQQVLDAASHNSFLSIAMVKDLPRGQIEDMETFIDFERPASPNSALSASVGRARNRSIYGQLFDLIEAKKGTTFSELAPLLEIDEFTLTERECPGLREAYRRITEQPWAFDTAPDFSDVISIPLHPRMYVLSSGITGGFRAEIWPDMPQYARVEEAFGLLRPCLVGEPAT